MTTDPVASAHESPGPVVPPQVVPRPPGWKPGAPAPWEPLDDELRRGLSVQRVLDALAFADQLGPPPQPTDDTVTPWVEVLDTTEPVAGTFWAAVLVALFQEEGEARVVLTRRSTRLRSHRGEVSFPGGRVDGTESPAQTALREATEEVSLDPASVEVRGWLHPLFTFASGSLIMPVIGTLESRPTLVASPTEVERIFDVALADLVRPGVFHEERWRIPGRLVASSPDGSFPVRFFEVAGELVWGATARMLVELLSLVLGFGPIQP